MVLLGEKGITNKTEWAKCKTILSDVNKFMKSLIDFDVESASEKIWKKARDGWINKDDFNVEFVKSKSVAAAVLCGWCRSCSSYQFVTAKVAPKKAKLKEVQAILKEA